MKTTRARPCPEATLTEWFSIGVLCWWTYLLLIPPHLFRTNLAFLGLSHQGTESAWALWTGSAAALLLLGQVTGGPILRCVALAVACGVWGYLATAISATSPRFYLLPVNTGLGNYVMIVIINFAAVLKLSRYAAVQALLIWGRRPRQEVKLL